MTASLEESRTDVLRPPRSPRHRRRPAREPRVAAASPTPPRCCRRSSPPTTASSRPRTCSRARPRTCSAPPWRAPRPRPAPPGRHRQRARLQPEHRERRLVQRPHHRPDRHRRHALPRRLGDRRAGQRRHRHPPHRPPAARRRAATPPATSRRSSRATSPARRQGRRRRRSPSRGCCCRSTARATRSAAPSSSARLRHVLEDVRAGGRGLAARCAASASCSPPSSRAHPPEGVDAERDRARDPLPALDGRGPLHLPRLPRLHPARRPDGEDLLAPVTGTGLGAAALRPAARPGARSSLSPQASAEGPRAEHPRAHQGQLPLHGAPHRPPRLRRRQAASTTTARSSASAASSASTPPRAYTESVLRVPLVAEKVQAVLDRSGVAPDSHTGKDLLAGARELPARRAVPGRAPSSSYDTAMAVTQLQERRRTKLFIREDDFGRFVSCLVYIPRDRYNTDVRLRMADILKETFGGESVEFTARVSESALSRLQFVVRVPKGKRVRILDQADAGRPRAAPRRGQPHLGRATSATPCARRTARRTATASMDRFGRAFPTAYEETFTVNQGRGRPRPPRPARRRRRHAASRSTARPTRPTSIRRFKLFRVDPLSLTDILPIFTHMGVEVVDEQPFEVTRADGTDPARLRLRPARARRRRSGRSARTTSCATSSRAPSPRSGTAAPSATASTGSCSPPS